MNISTVGYKAINRVVLPMAVALPLLAGCARNGVVRQSGDKAVPHNEELVENRTYHDTVEIENKGQNNKTHNGLLYGLLGFLGVSTVLGLSQARAKRIENEVKQTFYKNNPSIVKFEEIKDEKEVKRFLARRKPLRNYLSGVLQKGLDSGEKTFKPDIDEYLEHVNKFTKYYPDRRELLLLGLLPFSDTRLKPEERGFVFAYIYSKATSLDNEWIWESEFKFLNSSKSYDEILHRMHLMRKIDTQMKTDAEAEREQSRIEAEQETMIQLSEIKKVTFRNVGGQDKAIEAIKKGILFPIKYPSAFEDVNLEHGFVLYGPPGTGKTLLAEALSNEAEAHFIKINGPELESKWVGATEENWRNIFDEAREKQPSIIFIDEFDSVASQRGGGDIHGDKALNQLLGLISDIKPDEKIFIIAATNRLDNIDKAFIRSGRLGTHIELKAPETVEDIMNIFTIHTKGKRVADDFNINDFCKKLMKINPSGADIAYIVNEAREKSLEREHIYEKMDDGTFCDADIEKLQISEIDFENALEEFHKNKFHKTKIGFSQ